MDEIRKCGDVARSGGPIALVYDKRRKASHEPTSIIRLRAFWTSVELSCTCVTVSRDRFEFTFLVFVVVKRTFYDEALDMLVTSLLSEL